MAKNINQSAAAVFLSAFGDETKSQHQVIPVEQITLHYDNTAAKNDTPESIQQLADSIEANGLIHPLAVNQIAEGQYRLLSGERRYRAITECLQWETVPCTVYNNLSTAMEQLILVSANLQARDYSAADKLELYVQAEAALREMKSSGKYRGGIQRGVAALLNVSEQQVGKYKAIVAGYTPDELPAIKNIDAAAKAVRQPKAQAPEPMPEPEPAKTESHFQFFKTSEPEQPTETSAVPEPVQPATNEKTIRLDGMKLSRKDADFAASVAVKEAQCAVQTLMQWAAQTEQPERLRQRFLVMHSELANAVAQSDALRGNDA